MKIPKSSCSWQRFCSFLAIALSLSLGTDLAHSGGLDIGDAWYKQEDDRFKVKGNTRDDAEVKLFDAHSGVLFATVNADDEGGWEYRKKHPAAIPCRVRAESAGENDEKNVEHASDFPGSCGIDAGEPPAPEPGVGVSINSTSQNGIPGAPVIEQPLAGNNNYRIFAINDLGMHCGDLDTRNSSILPPFNVFHALVVERGSEPNLLTPSDGVEVVYSASSNPNDPIILTGENAAGEPVLSSVANGEVYKTNFWDIARGAYDPFYPPGILPAFYPPANNILDLGLPMPDVERLYLGDGELDAVQQAMPGRFGPYVLNEPQTFNAFVTDQPFFLNFPFGYVAEGVDWYEAAGFPLTAFDDFGRENPWALMRVQARSGGQILASLDTVAPISGEANCGLCHKPVAPARPEARHDSECAR
jgi:hypothetical protein